MIHAKIHNTKSERRKSKLRLKYKMKDREVKRIATERTKGFAEKSTQIME